MKYVRKNSVSTLHVRMLVIQGGVTFTPSFQINRCMISVRREAGSGKR